MGSRVASPSGTSDLRRALPARVRRQLGQDHERADRCSLDLLDDQHRAPLLTAW